MSRNKGFAFFLLLVMILPTLITACGGEEPTEAPEPAETTAETAAPEPTEAPAAEPVTVVYLSAGTAEVEQDWNEKWVKAFNDTHPNIQIQYELVAWADLLTKVSAMIAGGNPPDIAWYAPSMIKEWYYGGLLEPLDEWLPQDIEELLPAIQDPAASDIIYDGKYYGMPFCLAGLGVMARKDLFAEAGYNTDELMNWDWETYKEVMAAVTKPEDNQYGMQFAFGEPRISGGKYWFLTNGLHDLTDFSDKDAYIEALQFSKDLFPSSPEAQLQWVHADTLTCYINGVCSVAFQGSYFYGDIKRQAPDIMSDEGTAVLPYPFGPRMDKCMVPWYTVGWVMFEASRHKAEAAEVLHFLASREAVNEWPMNMAPKTEITLEDRIRVSEFGEDLQWWLEDWYAMMEDCEPRARPGYAPSNEINQIYTEVLLELYDDSITVEEAYDKLKAGIEPIVIAPGQ